MTVPTAMVGMDRREAIKLRTSKSQAISLYVISLENHWRGSTKKMEVIPAPSTKFINSVIE
jgi:hypothetical protein